ncbi:glucose-6-phosphate/phosphate translocator 1, chloroplastic isoform X2 [Alnus glutinosa]|uniref:glucose-6-phosphate/phosphate translocator 1, chloroplastic isoform X1 n=1 Tax=Alnus glutinosa TaxID=3517 RepID=UPI002D79608E|nr:glucose-6-phosphate/phosphate translocator 1, chloroplastic isoform X1 [Alnus glutinosa]XP_062169034.1 glucose-6-phosphate/phosphate translocator 1, chloroplastic isoform X2 [Alnus glutinosa]
MICSAKQSLTATINGSDLFLRKRLPAASIRRSSLLLPALHKPERLALSVSKPLHVSSVENLSLRARRDSIKCEAYEAADQSKPVQPEGKSEAAKKVKIGVYFATWWALNVVFNIYNKKVLNAFPYPWLTSTLSLACGSLMMLVSWTARIAETPKTDFDFWKALFPVAVAHTIGHVAATVSMSKVAVSFTHIIKSGEPAFSVLVSRFLLGESFPVQVYLSLLPIIGGCALAAVTELNFNMIGFMGAMISNLAFVFRNIFSKRGMKGKSVSGMNYYACLSMLSLLILTPFAIAVEGPQMWAAGWQTAISEIGPNFIWWVAAQSVFYHLYNQVSYMSLDEISPLTFSIGNTMKRISVIVSSIIIFHTPVQPINALGAAIAVAGTFIYSQAKQ